MARFLTVSAFSCIPPQPKAGEDLVDYIIGFWRKEIGKVLPDRPDLVVLPEVCDRCDDDIGRAEYHDYCLRRGPRFRDAMAEVARKHRLFIACPTQRSMSDGSWRNSVELLDRQGESVGIYDKNFPTIGEIETGILPGDAAPVFDTELGRIACAICFDLNFEELLDQYGRQKAELILFSSMYHGGLMQAYWAYRCRAHFVAAVGRLPSAVLSPVGHTIAASTNYFPRVTTRINLDCAVAHLDYNWDKLEAMKQRYGTEADYLDPGLLAPVLISSRSDKRSVADLMKEFGFEQIDDYLQRSRAARTEALKNHRR